MNALIIANTQIRRDPTGRYCLNDLHQASGGHKRHQPSDWLRLKQTQELVAELTGNPGGPPGIPGCPPGPQQGVLEIQQAPVQTVNDGFGNGTYAVKELVYAYAMWISAKFHLAVIRAYDALVTGAAAVAPSRDEPLSLSHRADVLVSADRTFRAAMRSARSMRLPFRRAMQQARAITLDRTGIDLVAELVGDEPVQPDHDADYPLRPCSVTEFHSALLSGDLGLPIMPGLSATWWPVYCGWCRVRGVAPATMKDFVLRLSRTCRVRKALKRYWLGGQLLGPHSFLMFVEPEVYARANPLLMRDSEPALLGYCENRLRSAISGAEGPHA